MTNSISFRARKECVSLSISVLTVCLITSCASSNNPRPSEQAASQPARESVQVYGALFKIMHEGRTERTVDLNELSGQKGLYGLGALEGLSGEVTIWNGEVWRSKPDGNGGALATRDEKTSDGATLLVTTEVAKWQEISVDKAVDFPSLDSFIQQAATQAGINTNEAFAFRIEGTVRKLDWHVIDGSKIPANAHGHAAHMKTAVRGKVVDGDARILGFYSPKHHAVFTHHDTNTHAHVILDTPLMTGHVDHVDIAAGARLFLPVL